MANFEELLESYPYCHLCVIIPVFSTTHGHLWTIWYYDREQARDCTWVIIISLLQGRDHFRGFFLKLKGIFETTRWQCNHMSDFLKVPELGF